MMFIKNLALLRHSQYNNNQRYKYMCCMHCYPHFIIWLEPVLRPRDNSIPYVTQIFMFVILMRTSIAFDKISAISTDIWTDDKMACETFFNKTNQRIQLH